MVGQTKWVFAVIVAACSSSFTTVFFVEALATRNVLDLKRWAAEQGVDFSPSATLRRDANGCWGLVYDTSLSMDHDAGSQVIIKVPKHLAWNARQVYDDWMAGPDSAVVEESLDQLKGWGLENFLGDFLLIVKLAQERTNPASMWTPWLNSLPTDLCSGVSMTETELGCLTTFCRAMAENERIKFRCFSAAADKILPNPNHSTDDNGDHGSETKDVLLWAFQILYSRSWRKEAIDSDSSGGLEVEMIPMLDLFNHRCTPNVELLNDEGDQNNVELHLKDEVLSTSSTEEELELFISYGGETSSDRFLVMFGFVDQCMQYCYSELVFPDPSQELVNLGCEDRLKMVFRCRDGAVSNTIYDCIVYALLTQIDREERDRFYAAHASENRELKVTYHDKYRPAIRAVLVNHIRSKLKELQTLSCRISSEDAKQHTPSLETIVRHNKFMTNVFSKAITQLESTPET